MQSCGADCGKVVQEMIIDTLTKYSKTQKDVAKDTGCSLSKPINGKMNGSKNGEKGAHAMEITTKFQGL